MAEVREDAIEGIKEGVSLLEVAEFVEKRIREKGAEPAFPCNISRNEEAAIGDSAVTVDLSGNNEGLVKASEAALNEAIKIIRDGVSTVEIEEVIENTIREQGYKPVVNLTGHGLMRYNSQCVKYEHGVILRENDVVAIEPFATDAQGAGKVVESGNAEIYSLIKAKPVRLREAKKLLVDKEISGVAVRQEVAAEAEARFSTPNFEEHRCIERFSSVERKRGLVSQAEHAVIVKEDGCEVTTIERII